MNISLADYVPYKIDMSFDMETSDPDDIFTLCLLATHPRVNLRSITITPGSDHQVGLVRHILNMLGRKDVPIGAYKPGYAKECVSEFHYKWLGKIDPTKPDGTGAEILSSVASDDPSYMILTGASLGNISSFLDKFDADHYDEDPPSPYFAGITLQGGFAGNSVVPEEYRLDKFKGKETCPTFNLNGNIPAAKHVVECKNFAIKRFVSKNVCHGIVYDAAMHERIKPHKKNNPGLELLVDGMEFYLANKPSGKAFHDPLAACVTIDPEVCEFRLVELYRQKGEWGSRLVDVGNTFISIRCDRERFERVLVGG